MRSRGRSVLLWMLLVAVSNGGMMAAHRAEGRADDSGCAVRKDLVGACSRTRGRISFYNGNPSFRMWRVGFESMVAGNDLFRDFVVCPLTTERAGVMQRVRVESASNLVLRSR